MSRIMRAIIGGGLLACGTLFLDGSLHPAPGYSVPLTWALLLSLVLFTGGAYVLLERYGPST